MTQPGETFFLLAFSATPIPVPHRNIVPFPSKMQHRHLSLIVLSSLLLVVCLPETSCQKGPPGGLVGGGPAGGGVGQTSCVQKLLPCQPFLNSTEPPSPTCCGPLMHALETDTACLCGILGNEALLKQFNVTKEEALALPKRCGSKSDQDVCKKAGDAPSPSLPATDVPPGAGKSGQIANSSAPGMADLRAATIARVFFSVSAFTIFQLL